ncbi:MAG: Ig-like domain-containing protein, partial [Sulfurimonas sp.]
NAANDAGEVVEDTTAVGNTDNAQTTLDDAVNAEIDDTVVSADLDDVSDTGASNEDNVTSDNTPTINGSAEAGAIVVVTTEIGDIVGTAVADENGNYSITTDPLTDGTHNLNITVTDSLGNSASTTQNITIDTASSDTSSLGITDISDNSGDYSSITMSGTGAEAGNTITIYDESDNAVATATVDEDGNWNADISNLNGTPVNDNEFFKVTETDIAGNETGEVDSTHFWHGSWSGIETDDTDDFVLMGSGDDTLHINDNDLNDSLVADGGTGHDTIVFDGNSSDYTITKNDDGSVTVIENVSTDNDGNNIGDVSELRNIETINFADGTYDVNSGELSQTVTINQDNLNDTQSGFNISAFDAYGNEASISNNSYGFGVVGNASGDNAELGYKEGVGSEKLVVDFDNDVSSVDVSFGWKNSSEDAEITFFKDGVEVGSTINHGGTDRIDTAVTLQPDNGESFDQVVFSAPEGGNHDYMINSISFEHVTSETVINEDTQADDTSLNISSDDEVSQSNDSDSNTASQESDNNEHHDNGKHLGDDKEHDQKGNDHEDNGKHLGNDQENNHEDNHHDSDFDFDQHLDFNSLLKSAEDESHHHDSKDSHDDNSFDLGGIIDSRDIGNDIFAHIDDKEESHEHGKDKDHDEHKEEHNEHEHHGKNDDSNEWSLGDFKTEKEYEADNSNRGDNERDGRSEDNGGLMDINTDIHVDNS